MSSVMSLQHFHTEQVIILYVIHTSISRMNTTGCLTSKYFLGNPCPPKKSEDDFSQSWAFRVPVFVIVAFHTPITASMKAAETVGGWQVRWELKRILNGINLLLISRKVLC